MSQPGLASRDLSDEEYRRECTLRNSAFIKARRKIVERWQSDQDLFAEPIVVARKVERGKGLDAIKEQQRKQGQFWSELVRLCNDWPAVSLFDFIAGGDQAKEPGPKVRLAPYHPGLWPKDGSILLLVDESTTGDEIKRGFQGIKRHLSPPVKTKDGQWKAIRRRNRIGRQTLKPQIHDVSKGKPALSLDNKFIILSVDPTSTGDEVRRYFQKIKRSLFPRRRRMGQRRLKLAIYDAYTKELKSFRQIAKTYKKPLSTVHGLFSSVYRDIGNIKGELRVDPDFDPREHWSSCPSCLKGRRCRVLDEKLGLPTLPTQPGKIRLSEDLDIPTLEKRGQKRPPKIDY